MQHNRVPIKATHKPLPGFEVSFAERELIKMFPSYCQSIKVIPAIIFCNRCKQEIPTNPQAITQHAAIHLINPKEDPNKFGCLVGNCWRRLPLTQLGAHVAGHFKTASASCGICGFIFPSPRLAREHLVSPCPQLQNAQSNFLANHPTDRKTQESIFRRLL
ncbi:hypothetical protein BDZ94DRAFT_135248 [Collybia nuda]|uniref:Uncharacterized protein n=1 Tax=Collybia nuda TaxID=64659 RepID=A0A9P5YDZ3_9AGAR|nr:hypothetical protein BDZ94DRAFT_135248 [Collybia nuda]